MAMTLRLSLLTPFMSAPSLPVACLGDWTANLPPCCQEDQVWPLWNHFKTPKLVGAAFCWGSALRGSAEQVGNKSW